MWSPLSEALLNSAARKEHVMNVIAPARAAGKIVLCDRFMDSTRAYQGYAGGVSPDVIDVLETSAVGECVPNLTLIFDLDPEIGLARAAGRGDGAETRFERKGLAFHKKLRAAFLEIAARYPERCIVINADRQVDAIQSEIREIVSSTLSKKTR
jgi:dTMP kinase